LNSVEIVENVVLQSKDISNAHQIAKRILFSPYLTNSTEIKQLEDMGSRKKSDFLDGSLLIDNRGDANLIELWINLKEIQSELLYRGSRDGFGAATFHELCDD
jgi:hypothetical protein